MYKPIVNQRIIKNHFQYNMIKYIAAVLIFALSWNLIITMTAPRTPEELKFDVVFVGRYMSEEDIEALQQQITNLLPEMEEVNVNVISYEKGGEMEVYSLQKLMAYFSAGEGDLYVCEPDLFKGYGEGGIFYELDEYMETFNGVYTEEEIENGYFPQVKREYDGNGEVAEENILTEPHQYGLPISAFKNMKTKSYIIDQQMAGVTVYSDNIEEALIVFKALIGIE